MRDINFIKNYTSVVEKSQKKSGAPRYNTICTAIICIFIISIIALTLFLEFKAKNLNENLAQLENDIAGLNEVVVVKKTIVDLEKDVAIKTSVLDSASLNGMINTEILTSITASMPKDVKIKSYTGNASGELTLVGTSKKREDIAYFVYNLEEIGIFENTNLSNITAENEDKPADLKYNFNITLKVKK